jgi:hypothetical protein
MCNEAKLYHFKVDFNIGCSTLKWSETHFYFYHDIPMVCFDFTPEIIK